MGKDGILRSNLIWLIVAQAVCILPLLLHLPIWIAAIWLIAVLWRVQIHRARWRFPSFWVKLLLGLGSAGGIYATFQGVTGVEPMIGFLVCSFILKVIEMRTKKDAIIVLFIGFIAVAAQFLFSQGIWDGIYGLFSTFVLLAAWQAAFISQNLRVPTHLRRGGVLLGQSVPFMLVLFVVMPRLGPLWSVPMPQGQGQTGFSDTLELGDIGELVKSPQVAFRASFHSRAPSADGMYWRGLALDIFDGRTWRASDWQSLGERLPAENAVADLYYSVVMEPHHYRWLFTLGFPVAADSAQLTLYKNQQNALFSREPVVNKSQYTVYSRAVERSELALLEPAQQAMLTRLPGTANPRARELAARWQLEGLAADAIVAEALGNFRRGYEYTLRPPTLGANAIDEFLFSTQRGFCEHFASSFVFLLRAAGIPARVIVGYQGGEYNGVEDYYVVRQSNAHAWAEVWLEGQGWIAVDPTAAAVPSRIEFGIEEALAEDDRRLVGGTDWRGRALGAVYQRLDALEYSWNRWVLNFDSDRQQGLIERLFGSDSPWRVGLAFVGICAIIFLSYVAVYLFAGRTAEKSSAELKAIRPLLRKLKRRGIHRQPGETLAQLAARVEPSHPQLAKALAEVDHWYSRALYAADPQAVARLREAVKAVD